MHGIPLGTLPGDASAFAALIVAFATALAAGPWVIARMRLLKFGQNINEFAPEGHQRKQGTPTMGGVLIVLGVVLGTAAAVLVNTFYGVAGTEPNRVPLAAVLLVFLGHAAIGFADDYLSIKRGKNLGLRARDKLIWQFAIAVVFVGWLWASHLPGFAVDSHPGIGWFVPACLIPAFLMMGISNATNFTDGLDGLLGGTAILATIGVTAALGATGSAAHLPWFGCALIGACLGFLWYNAHPALIFMGDTGSLAIGAALTAMAVIGKEEWLLLVFSLVFLMEIGSVMIQVPYFKLTGGRRVFKMTPIHHHFEKSGWPETTVVVRFTIIGALALAAGLMLARVIHG
ncbi:MAG: phospho-N-acetylmuramoyl-pentapeptide-transferase [Capsulimonadaceae bacterium]